MITILTPTYNRGYILHKAYESLKWQTSKDFEWIVVDDGSSDNTEELVSLWQKEDNRFSIIYHKQKNGGKHRAVNKGVTLANSEYILILDSDDYLTPDALEKIHKWIETIKGIDDICGVVGEKGYENKKIDNAVSLKYLDITNLERKKYNLQSDKAEIYKTEIMKKFPFPEFEGENFLRESASWDRIAQAGYKLRFFNDVIYICEYIEDGLTKNTTDKTYAKNFNGFLYCTNLYLDTQPFIYRLNKYGHFYNVAKLKNISIKECVKMLSTNRFIFTLGICFFNFRQVIKNAYKKIKQSRR